MDDESEFFTLGGSLLASGTGEVGFVTAQAARKDRKRRRSEAAATDAPTAVQPAPTVQQTAARPTSHAATHASVPALTSKAGKSQGVPPCCFLTSERCSHKLLEDKMLCLGHCQNALLLLQLVC